MSNQDYASWWLYALVTDSIDMMRVTEAGETTRHGDQKNSRVRRHFVDPRGDPTDNEQHGKARLPHKQARLRILITLVNR